MSSEIKWIIYLAALVFTVFGMLTGFRFDSTWDVSVVNTYLVLSGMHMLIGLTLILSILFLLAIGLKRLARKGGVARTAGVSIMGIITIAFPYLFLVSLMRLDTGVTWTMSLAAPILFGGIGGMYLIRTWRMTASFR